MAEINEKDAVIIAKIDSVLVDASHPELARVVLKVLMDASDEEPIAIVRTRGNGH